MRKGEKVVQSVILGNRVGVDQDRGGSLFYLCLDDLENGGILAFSLEGKIAVAFARFGLPELDRCGNK